MVVRNPFTRPRSRRGLPAVAGALGAATLTLALGPAAATAAVGAVSAGSTVGSAPATATVLPGTANALPATSSGLSAASSSVSESASTQAAPATAAAQVAWLLSVSHHLPVPAAALRAHVSATFLTLAGGPAVFNRTLASVSGAGGLARIATVQSTATFAQVVVGGSNRYLIELGTGPDGRIAGLLFNLWSPGPRTWAALDRRLAAVAPQASFLAARVDADGRCVPLHAVAAGTPRPLGSVFKLYVLAALAHQIAAGRDTWSEQLAIRTAWKSLPSGVLQNLPAGTRLALEQYADAMIALSDNTAADHLIHHLGRGVVEAQLRRSGMARPPRDVPFPTTRELFQLKISRNAANLRAAFLRLPPKRRRAFLTGLVDRLPLPALAAEAAWTRPIAVDRVEWFASASDICRVYSTLARQAARPALAPVSTALSMSDEGVGLSRSQWPTVWFKGGSEPGVLTVTYLARSSSGSTYVVSVLTADPTRAIPPAEVAELVALARGGLQLSRGVR